MRGHPRRPSKSLGSSNAINIVHATVGGLKGSSSPSLSPPPRPAARTRGAEAMLRARAEADAKERADKQVEAVKAENEAAVAGVGA